MPIEVGEPLAENLIQAAVEYELAWNRYSSVVGGDSVEVRLEKARAHQALLVAVRRYIGDWE